MLWGAGFLVYLPGGGGRGKGGGGHGTRAGDGSAEIEGRELDLLGLAAGLALALGWLARLGREGQRRDEHQQSQLGAVCPHDHNGWGSLRWCVQPERGRVKAISRARRKRPLVEWWACNGDRNRSQWRTELPWQIGFLKIGYADSSAFENAPKNCPKPPKT